MGITNTAPNKGIISTEPFPASKKVFVKGMLFPDVSVAMREISLENKLGDINAPVNVYDTSGPYTDASIAIDIYKGLPKLRKEWILGRGDVEKLDQFSSEFANQRIADTKTDAIRFPRIPKP